VLARMHALATVLWGVLAGGAAAGFVARDALGLRQPLVALAWTLGAAAPTIALLRGRLAALGRRGRGHRGRGSGERGQATVELTALVLLVALVLAAVVAASPRFDGRSFGGFLAFHVTCAVKRDCGDRGDLLLADAYGPRDAALVRELAPNLVYEGGERQLPVDWRACRRPACAEAPDERGLDAHRTDQAGRATAFTRLVERSGRVYLQYWLYYPDSKSVWAASDLLWERAWQSARGAGLTGKAPAYPGTHPDDWEAYAIRLDADGRAWVRASSHGVWQACKELRCQGRWTRRTGWVRVSRGSHAGHIPMRHVLDGPRPLGPRHVLRLGRPHPRLRAVPLLPGHDLDERTTTGEGLRLIPLETLDRGAYRPLDESVLPPWEKDAYRDPEADAS
jgi:hypothetical protein